MCVYTHLSQAETNIAGQIKVIYRQAKYSVLAAILQLPSVILAS